MKLVSSEIYCECSHEEDSTIFGVWRTVNDIIHHQTLLESLMKEGYISIAKSRYIMGQQAVCESQLPGSECAVSAAVLLDRDVECTFNARRGSGDPDQPLRWFSALPPAPLRQARTRFRRAVDVSCQLATLRTQLVTQLSTLRASCPQLSLTLAQLSLT